MRPVRIFALYSLTVILVSSCKKDNHPVSDCFPDAVTIRQIINAEATIKEGGGKFYIVEKTSIDSKLNPYSLPAEFQINNLQVKISGDVKATIQVGPDPCCTENFVITKITRK